MGPYFVDVKDIYNIFVLSEGGNTPALLYDQMLSNNIDIIYVVEGDKLAAVVTTGDLYRYYVSYNDTFELNYKFSFVSEIDYEAAEKVFKRIKTIHEVPVIENGKFIGVIRKGEERSQEEWDCIHRYLEKADSLGEQSRFLIDEIKRWQKKTEDIELYIYESVYNILPYLSEEQKEKFDEKMEVLKLFATDSKQWKIENGYNPVY